MDPKPTCPNCFPPKKNLVYNGLKCWIKRHPETATFTAILKRHNEMPVQEEITHMKKQLIKLKQGWYKKGWMEFIEVAGPYGSPLPGGHYMLKFRPKEVFKSD